MGSRGGDRRRRLEDRRRRVIRMSRWVVKEEIGGGECLWGGDG